MRLLWALPIVASWCACAGVPAPGSPLAADPLAGSEIVVLVFVRTDCPIANRYAPAIQDLARQHGPRGVRFVLVYPDADATPGAIDAHRAEYGLALPALRDPDHHWVLRTGVARTPEVAVFDRADRLVYRGRIDDRFPELGTARAAPTTRDLEDVLRALEQGDRPAFVTTIAVGCPIPALD